MNGTYYHPTALVETSNVGAGTKVWAFAHVMKDVVIGSNCNIGDHCFIESGVVIGNNVTIKNGNMLFEGITLEDGVFVGPHVFFTNDLHPRSPRLPQAKQRYEDKTWLSPTTVRYGASLGAGCVIIAGISIGEFAMIGAGAVVTKKAKPYALLIGNPARIIGWVCQCGHRLVFQDNNAICKFCDLSYHKDKNNVIMQNNA